MKVSKGSSKRKRRRSATEDVDDRLHSILTNCADIGARKLFLTGEIDEPNTYRFMAALQVLDLQEGPITVILNSCGGLCHEGLAIYDAIRFAQNEVYIVVYGQASSMGSIILQAGDKRLMSENATFMIHDPALFHPPDMNLHQIQTEARELRRLRDLGTAILSVRSGNTVKEVNKISRRETWFSAQETVNHGFADEVLKPTKEIK